MTRQKSNSKEVTMLILMILLFFVGSMFLSGCSSVEKVETFKEAVSNQDNNLKAGVYQNERGQNVYVESKNLDQKIKELEKDNNEYRSVNWHYQTEIESLKKEKAKLLLEIELLKRRHQAVEVVSHDEK